MNCEDYAKNNLFFTCSFIEYLARKTKNTKKDIILKLGKENIQKIYDLAEMYHTENMQKICDEFINKCSILDGNYDVILNSSNKVPSHFEIGRVYERLITRLSENSEKYIDTLIIVLTSWIILKIDNYDTSLYFENPDYIYNCYINGKII